MQNRRAAAKDRSACEVFGFLSGFSLFASLFFFVSDCMVLLCVEQIIQTVQNTHSSCLDNQAPKRKRKSSIKNLKKIVTVLSVCFCFVNHRLVVQHCSTRGLCHVNCYLSPNIEFFFPFVCLFELCYVIILCNKTN